VVDAFDGQGLAGFVGDDAHLQRDQGFQVGGQGYAGDGGAGAFEPGGGLFDGIGHFGAQGVPLAAVAYGQARAQVGLRHHFRAVQAEGEVGGIDSQGFGRILSKGDAALFGGLTTQNMKGRLAVPEGRPLADYLRTITIKARDFANEITNTQVKQQDLRGEPSITHEHVKNNRDVRRLLTDRNIVPEQLPPAEDLKKLERRLKSEQKKLP